MRLRLFHLVVATAMRSVTARPFILLIIGMSHGNSSFGGPAYFVGLGTENSRALGVSPDGSVVIGYASLGTSRVAMRWSNGQALSLGHLPGGSVDSLARAVSANGVILGRSSSAASGADLFEATRWYDGTVAGLGDLPGGLFYSEAWDVSDDGSTEVGRATSASGAEAFRWQNGVMQGLGDLPGGVFSSSAHAVSASGSIVVGKASSAAGTEAFRWENGLMSPLGFLPGVTHHSEALAVSADGQVIVGMSSAGYGQTTAFRWQDGVMTSLGYLPGGEGPSIARAVSADGSVIVGDAAMSNSVASLPFIYTPSGGMRALTDVLDGLGVDTSDWILEMATGVSDDGRSIVGYGIHLGPAVRREAWIAVVPEPNGLLLILGALLCLRSRPRRL